MSKLASAGVWPQTSFNRVVDNFSPRLHRALYNAVLERTGVNSTWPDADRNLVQELDIEVNRFHRFHHARAVRDAVAAAARIDLRSAADAFVHGFTRENAAFRSVLRGYAFCRHLAIHRFSSDPGSDRCRHCGLQRKGMLDPTATASLNAAFAELGFHEEIVTSTWAMDWFSSTNFPGPSDEDRTGLQRFFDLIADAPSHYTAKTLSAKLPKQMFGNQNGRRNAFTTLILAGVLESNYSERLLERWTPWSERTYDWAGLPGCPNWTRADGVHADVFQSVFPDLKLPVGLATS